MAFDQIAQQFCNHYYPCFAGDRSQLAPLYRDESMLTFQNERLQGVAAIMDKLTGEGRLSFRKIKHIPASVDAHPSVNNGVLIQVTGHVVADDDEEHPLPFAQTFLLQPIPGAQGGFYVLSDVFRIIVHM